MTCTTLQALDAGFYIPRAVSDNCRSHEDISRFITSGGIWIEFEKGVSRDGSKYVIFTKKNENILRKVYMNGYVSSEV